MRQETNPTGFNVGDSVRHSGYVINKVRDYWLNCGREPMKSGAKADLDKKTNARGVVEEIRQGKAAWIVRVKWDDGSVHESLPYVISKV